MRKIISTIICLLVMTEGLFAQMRPKVLWEKTVYTFSTENIRSVRQSISFKQATNGHLLTDYSYNVQYSDLKPAVSAQNLFVINRSGKELWAYKDYLKNISTPSIKCHEQYFILSNSPSLQDSAFLFNQNFEFIRSFDTRSVNYMIDYENGLFQSDKQNRITKFTTKGTQEWIYQADTKTTILTSQAPYLGLADIPNNEQVIVLLDKNGLKQGVTQPVSYNQIFPTKDNGFWLVDKSYNYIKFDSTGRQTSFFGELSGTYNYISSESILDDNSLLLYTTTSKNVTFIKVSPNGRTTQRLDIPLTYESPTSNIYSKVLFNRIISSNTLMYALREQSNEGSTVNFYYKIGTINLDTFGNIWQKIVDVGNSTITPLSLADDGTFFIIGNTLSNPIVSCYDINGLEKWRVPTYTGLNSSLLYKKTDKFLYVTTPVASFCRKIDYITGAVIWQKPYSIVGNTNTQIASYGKSGDIVLWNQVDTLGIKHYFCTALNDVGDEIWTYSLPAQINIISANLLVDKESVILNTLELVNNQYKQVLRKITPCSYNYSSSVALPDSGVTTLDANVAKNTICPNEQVTLSAPTYAGAVYEWRRDGKVFAQSSSPTQVVNSSGTYQVSIKDTVCLYAGISNKLRFDVPTPISLAIQAPTTSVCEGEKITLEAKTSETSSFVWQKNNAVVEKNTLNLEPKSSGLYRLASYNEQCNDSVYSASVPITIKPLPDVTVETEAKGGIYNHPSVKMTAKTENASSYQWYRDENVVPNATKYYYETNVSGTYRVAIEQNGCNQLSRPLSINIFVPLVTENDRSEDLIRVYPNPSNGQFSVTLPPYLQGATLQLFDNLGKSIASISNSDTIITQQLPVGSYFLKISQNGKTSSVKIIVE